MWAATRKSPLALWQTRYVGSLLSAAGVVDRLHELHVSTQGDQQQNAPIHTMGGKGVFAKEVQQAVLDGRADLAVHSAKDLPSSTPEGLCIAAITPRGDTRDALVGAHLRDLPHQARIATGSARRRAQLAWHRPDLEFFELRGNITTRLRKAENYHAIVMALAAIQRLELKPEIVEPLDHQLMVPQVAQGAIAVECRAEDSATRTALKTIEDPVARVTVAAERAFLAELGGDCTLPAGAIAIFDDTNPGHEIEMLAILASLDGQTLLRHQSVGKAIDPAALGRNVARHLLDKAGGNALLANLRTLETG